MALLATQSTHTTSGLADRPPLCSPALPETVSRCHPVLSPEKGSWDGIQIMDQLVTEGAGIYCL